MKKTLLWLILTCCLFASYGQVGINTTNPQAMLDIKSQGNSAATKAIRVANSSGKEILTILDNGNIGLGVTDPVTSIDLRDTDIDGILGLAESSQSASVTGAGALIYNNSSKYLNLSDGNTWKELAADYPKANVLANFTGATVPTFSNGGGFSSIKNWNKLLDTLNSFDTSTGVFTAPNAGIYTVSFIVSFYAGNLAANSYVKARWVASNGITITTQVLNYTAISRQIGILCSGSFKLAVGETLTPQIENVFGSAKTVDPTFSNLSIIEN